MMRNMTTEPADPHQVQMVVDSARYAPNAGNRRLQPVIAVTDREQLMLLAAHAVGLASCPVTSFSKVAVGRILGLADEVTAAMIVCLGHPAIAQPPAIPAPLPIV